MQLRLSSSCSCCLFKPLLSLRFECCKRLHVIYSFSKSFMKINPPRAKSFKSFIKYVTPNIFPFLQCLIFSSSLGFSLGKRRAAPFFSQALTLGLRSQWHRWGLAAWRGVNANGVHDQTKGVLQAPNCLGIDGKHHLLPTFFFRTRRKCKTVEKGRDNSKKIHRSSHMLWYSGVYVAPVSWPRYISWRGPCRWWTLLPTHGQRGWRFDHQGVSCCPGNVGHFQGHNTTK